MLMPEWMAKLQAAAEAGRELRFHMRDKQVVLVGAKDGEKEMDLITFPSLVEYLRKAAEISKFFESKRKVKV